MVRAHRQAWCWQDEWYGLTIEDIRQLELETQLALAKKMAQYSLNEEGGTETNGSSVSQDQETGAETAGSVAEAEGGGGGGGGGGKLGDSLETRGELTKQWSTSSRSSNRSSKRGGEEEFVAFTSFISLCQTRVVCDEININLACLQGVRRTRAFQSGGCRASPETQRTAQTMSSLTLMVKSSVSARCTIYLQRTINSSEASDFILYFKHALFILHIMQTLS